MLLIYNDHSITDDHSVTVGNGNAFANDTVIGEGGIFDKKESR